MTLPTPPLANVTFDGALTVIGTSSGSVPAGTPMVGGVAVKSDGSLYVVYV